MWISLITALNYSLQIRAYKKVAENGKREKRRDSSSNLGKFCQITQRTEGSDGLVNLQLALADCKQWGYSITSECRMCFTKQKRSLSSPNRAADVL